MKILHTRLHTVEDDTIVRYIQLESYIHSGVVINRGTVSVWVGDTSKDLFELEEGERWEIDAKDTSATNRSKVSSKRIYYHGTSGTAGELECVYTTKEGD